MTWAELCTFVVKRFAAAHVTDPLRVVFPSTVEGRPIMAELEVQRRLAPVATLRIPVAFQDELVERPGLEAEFGSLRLVDGRYVLSRVLVLWSLEGASFQKALDQLARESQRIRRLLGRRDHSRFVAA